MSVKNTPSMKVIKNSVLCESKSNVTRTGLAKSNSNSAQKIENTRKKSNSLTVLNACNTPTPLYKNLHETPNNEMKHLATPKSNKNVLIGYLDGKSTPECFSKVSFDTPKRLTYKNTSLEMKDKAEISNLKVAVRVRPMNAKEYKTPATLHSIVVSGNEITVMGGHTTDNLAGVSHSFKYDEVYVSSENVHDDQRKVFRGTALPLVDLAFEGKNTCLFAYGQTGSGKSYSMMGIDGIDDDDNMIGSKSEAGIIPRYCQEIFQRINKLKGKVHVEVEVSYFEIYNEKIHDLLALSSAHNSMIPTNNPNKRATLRVREHPLDGPYVVNLSTHPVNSHLALRNWLALGNSQRATAATGMNNKSSRSHSIFNIVLSMSDNECHTSVGGKVQNKRSKISLVDLAGSERLSQTCTSGDRLREGVSINRSLLTLGKVIAALSDTKKMSNGFVPYRESVLTWLLREEYAGIFHFRFWQYVRWIDVVIDDRLPTYRGELVYMHSTEKNEFWSALLEKAYAKLHGSYEALKGGTTCEAMEDFTGGVTEMYELSEAPPNLFNILMKGFERNSMMACSIEPDPSVLEAETPQGLIKGHAYSITKVELMDILTPNTSGKIPMVRLRNPWGNEAEWNGPWSDQSAEWRFIPEHVKMDIGLTFDHDGEFWMSFQDWMKYFDRVELCNLSPDSLSEEQVSGGKKKWEMSVYEGEWTYGITAGGCRNFLDSFWRNPQYVVTLEDPDEDDDDGKCTVIIALMQKNRRSKRNMGMDCLTIGVAVYQVTERDLASKPLKMNFFKYNASVARSPAFINLREVSCRFKLPPGHYLVVPSTFEPNEEGEFLIRVFSETKKHMEENDEEVGVGQLDDRIASDVPEPSKPTPQITALEQLFRDIAGEDMEVDWMELKRILDHSMREDFGPQLINGNYATQTHATSVQNANGIDDSGGGGGGGGGLLATFCAAFCKDNPLGEALGVNEPTTATTTQLEPIPTQPITSQIMNNEGFSKDVCRSMVAMMDVDASGKLGFEEFKQLLTEIAKWKAVFKLYDRDHTGRISAADLREALNSAGYKLNNRILNALAHRYSDGDGNIAFDDFIMCAVKIKTMMNTFKERDVDGTNNASFNMQDWLEKTVYS